MNNLEQVARARAVDTIAQTIIDIGALAFAAGYSRATYAALDFSVLSSFADRYAIPRLFALAVQAQLRTRESPIDRQALDAVGAIEP